MAAAFFAAARFVAAFFALRIAFALTAGAGGGFLLVGLLAIAAGLLAFFGGLHLGLRVGCALALLLIARADSPFVAVCCPPGDFSWFVGVARFLIGVFREIVLSRFGAGSFALVVGALAGLILLRGVALLALLFPVR